MHVLSTPPAFILSQDQTLIKYVLLHKTLKSYFVTPRCFSKHQVCLVSLKLTNFNSFLILCLRIHSIAWMMFTKDVYLILMNYCTHLEILKKNFQGCLSVQLSKFITLKSSIYLCLRSFCVAVVSRRLDYNSTTHHICQQLFSIFLRFLLI